MNRSPLYELHERLGATFGDRAGWETARAFQGLEAEYTAARTGVALTDRSPGGRVRVTGEEALDLLHRISTNDLEGLTPGQGTTTIFTSLKGRVIDWCTLLLTHEGLLLLTAPETPQTVMEWIDRHAIIEEITLADLTHETAQISVLGPRAGVVVGSVLGQAAGELPLYGNLTASWGGGEALVARTDPVGLPGYDIIVPAPGAEALWERLSGAGEAAGIVALGEDALDVLRVEAGVPRWGAEMDERYNPLEANLGDAIDWVKGCYIGQEVVARLNTYHKVRRYLVSIEFEAGAAPGPGASLLVEGATAGALTSVAYSPGLGRHLGLGYLRTQFVKPDTVVTAATEDGGTATGRVTRAPEVPEEALSTAAVVAMMGGGDEEDEE